jgi:microtubule-associated serine/threonine kinase
MVRQVLMIVSRAARLLECLEFNPEQFYQILEDVEGQVREQFGASADARLPDLPQYIINKLGLDRDPLQPDKSPPPYQQSG